MKHFFTLLSVLIAGQLLTARPALADSVNLNSKITAVTVYPSQAQITRSASRELPAGEHTLVFENIPVASQTASFRSSASGPQGLALLGMNHRQEFHTESTNEKVAELERQIAQLNDEVKREINDRLDVFNQQKKFLLTLTKTATKTLTEQVENGGIKIAEWRSAYSFVSEEVRATNDSIRIVSAELKKVNDKLQKLKSEYNQLRTSQANSSWTVEVDVSLKKAGIVKVELQYVITGASWKPLYDARMNEEKGEVELSYLAEVAQRTGEDWSNVTLALSTATPSSGTGPGELANWVLAPSVPVGFYRALGSVSDAVEVYGEQVIDKYEVQSARMARKAKPRSTEYEAEIATSSVSSGAFSTTFNIARKESVASGKRAVRVSINSWQLQSEVDLICRPRNSQSVYRLVTLTNQDDAPLLPGGVSIFSGTDFLGNSTIQDLVTPSQKFELPFGLENTIAVERKIDSYKTDRNTTRVRVEQTIKITLTNNGADSASLTLEEPLPVSQDKEIKVRVKGIKPEPLASEDKKKVTWEVILAPGQEMEFIIPVRIEYPLNVLVSGL